MTEFEEYLRGTFEINNGVENDVDNLVRIHAPELLKLAKKELMKDAVEGEVIDKGDFIKFADGKYIDLNPTMGAEPFVKLEDGDKVKVIIIKE